MTKGNKKEIRRKLERNKKEIRMKSERNKKEEIRKKKEERRKKEKKVKRGNVEWIGRINVWISRSLKNGEGKAGQTMITSMKMIIK